MVLSRRRFFRGAGLLLAAPAIVKIANIMPIKPVRATVLADWVESVGYSVGQLVSGPDGIFVCVADVGELERAFIDHFLKTNDLLAQMPFRRA